MLFEKMDGLLMQVPPELEEQTKERRHFHNVATTIQVLFSLEEEQELLNNERAEEETARSAAEVAAQEAERARAAEVTLSIQERLARLGVSFNELRDEILAGAKK